MAGDVEIPRGLPVVYRQIAQRVGLELALDVARQLGGTRLHVPARAMTRAHVLARCYGLDRARAIAAALEPGTYELPTARTVVGRHDARQLRQQGLAVREIARRIGRAERTVKAYVAGVRPDPQPAAAEAPGAPPVCPSCGRRHRRRVSKAPGPLPLFDRCLPPD